MSKKANELNLPTVVFFLGFFSTTPIITISYKQYDIAVFRVIFYGILMLMIVNTIQRRFIHMPKYMKGLNLWFLESLFSCLCGWLYFYSIESEFSRAAFSYVPKVAVFLLFSLVWGNQESDLLSKCNSKLVKGIFYGCIANLIWAIIDGFVFYSFGISINNRLFNGYIQRHNVRYGMLSLVTNSGLFRAAGFNSDPAQVGFIAPLVMCYGLYKKKPWMIIIAILGTLTSASTTALVSSIVVLMIVIISKKKPSKKIRGSGLALIIIIVPIIIIILISFKSQLDYFVNTASEKFFDRVNALYFESETQSNIRWSYLVYAPIAWFNLSFLGVFGTGFGTASYGYVSDEHILSVIGQNRKFAYDPENTYVSYLLDTGIIGLIIYLVLTIKLFKYYKRKVNSDCEFDLIEYSAILAIFLSMFFYHYILFTPQILFLIAGLSMMSSNNIEVHNK